MKFAAVFLILAIGGAFSQLRGQAALGTDSGPSTSAPAAAPRWYGRIDGDTYVSPTGLHRVKIPVLPQLGAIIDDTPNVVTFDDAYSVHVTIGAFPFSPELKAEYETRGTKEFLISFFTSIIMPDFAANFPGSTMEPAAAFLPKVQDGSVLIFNLIPGGSNFEQRTRFSSAIKPVVAKRGNLCFVKSGYVFIISTELAERAFERSTYKRTTEEENAILRQRLLDLAAKMQVTPVQAAPKN